VRVKTDERGSFWCGGELSDRCEAAILIEVQPLAPLSTTGTESQIPIHGCGLRPLREVTGNGLRRHSINAASESSVWSCRLSPKASLSPVHIRQATVIRLPRLRHCCAGAHGAGCSRELAWPSQKLAATYISRTTSSRVQHAADIPECGS
jgi:hypothetical protein